MLARRRIARFFVLMHEQHDFSRARFGPPTVGPAMLVEFGFCGFDKHCEASFKILLLCLSIRAHYPNSVDSADHSTGQKEFTLTVDMFIDLLR